MSTRRCLSLAAVFLLGAFLLPSVLYAAGGGIDPVYKYAWSEDYGWFDFNAPYSDVQVTDTALTGDAWNENTGWINMDPSSSIYVHNDGQGNLSGYAWGSSTGYINFSGVTIDSQGYFHGYAMLDNGSKINFNCANTNSCAGSDFKVKTYWTPEVVSVSPAINSGGGGGGGGFTESLLATVKKAVIAIGSSTLAIISPPTPAAINAMPAAYQQACKEVRSYDSPTLTKDLNLGMEDADVVDLQKFLNTNGYPLTDTGVGSYGHESLFFGSITKTALAKFQEANGLTNELGTAGPKTRALMQKMSASSTPSYTTICNVDLCPQYLTSYIRLGRTNDPSQVMRLKNFLRTYQGFTNIASTTRYDVPSFNDVVLFQNKFASDILGPWSNLTQGTGYVYKTTTREINRLYCQYQYQQYLAS